MRWRNQYSWALCLIVACAALPAFGGHAGIAASSLGSMSGPSAPIASFESTPAAHVQHSHFDWCAHALRPCGFSIALQVSRAAEESRRIAGSAQACYGPLYQRPPPAIS